MKIAIDNRTSYDTVFLRQLLRRCFIAVGMPFRSPRQVTVKIRSYRTSIPTHVGGYAYLGHSPKFHGRSMSLKLPRGGVRYDHLTWLMWHEALHLVGAEHKDMTPEQLRWEKARTPEWAKPEPYEVVAEREKVAAMRPAPAEVTAARLAHARDKHANALTRERRWATQRKKWAAKIKRLERKVEP